METDKITKYFSPDFQQEALSILGRSDLPFRRLVQELESGTEDWSALIGQALNELPAGPVQQKDLVFAGYF